MPDEAARVAGLQAGDYDLGLDIGNDQYTVLKDFPGVVAEILTPTELGRLLPELEVADDGEPGDAPGGPGGARPRRRCCNRAAAATISSGSIRD